MSDMAVMAGTFHDLMIFLRFLCLFLKALCIVETGVTLRLNRGYDRPVRDDAINGVFGRDFVSL
jgi:hypothetical protein